MTMSPDAWALAALSVRLLLYASMASVAGSVLVGILIGVMRHDAPRLRNCGLLAGSVAAGLLTSIWYFLIRVGAVSQQGVAGMGDWQMGRIMADTALGDGTALRIAGFLAIALALPVMRLLRSRAGWWTASLIILAGGLLLAGSFATFGHARELSWIGRIAVMAHVMAIALWTGSLWPLWQCCRVLPPEQLKQVMRSFGDLARWILAVMALSGGVLLLQLAGGLTGLTGSAYGRVLLFKLLLVAGLAGIGARHRYRLVPDLQQDSPAARLGAAARLRTSLVVELVLAITIMAVTVALTGLFSPPE